MVERIAGIVVPIFLVVLVGFLYGRKHAPNMEAANRINIDVFTPFLILSVFASRPVDLGDYAPLALGAILVTLLPGIGAYYLARAIGVSWKTFVPPMMFRNSGNTGLPLMLFTFGEAFMPAAVILFIVENTLHFTVGAWLLNPRTHLLHVLKNPMIDQVSTVDRRQLWAALTPQCFRYGRLYRALSLGLANAVPLTDEASAMEWMGDPVGLVSGSSDNIKVTHPDDRSPSRTGHRCRRRCRPLARCAEARSEHPAAG